MADQELRAVQLTSPLSQKTTQRPRTPIQDKKIFEAITTKLKQGLGQIIYWDFLQLRGLRHFFAYPFTFWCWDL